MAMGSRRLKQYKTNAVGKATSKRGGISYNMHRLNAGNVTRNDLRECKECEKRDEEDKVRLAKFEDEGVTNAYINELERDWTERRN